MIADAVLYPRDEVYEAEGEREAAVAYAALAIKLKANPGVTFRAIVEQWERQRIVRELY